MIAATHDSVKSGKDAAHASFTYKHSNLTNQSFRSVLDGLLESLVPVAMMSGGVQAY